MKFEYRNTTRSRLPFKLFDQTVKAFAKVSRQPQQATVSIALIPDSEMKKLNRTYQGLNCTTDVLAFAVSEESDKFKSAPEAELFLGEVVISYPVAKRQAQEAKHSLNLEVAYLLVHGLLHLTGYDHQTIKERNKMQAMTEKILRQIKFSN